MIRNQYGRQVTHSEIRAMLGISVWKLPTRGIAVTVIQGHDVWVLPAFPRTRRKSSKHRVMAGCPRCHRPIPVGRLQQHDKACKETSQ